MGQRVHHAVSQGLSLTLFLSSSHVCHFIWLFSTGSFSFTLCPLYTHQHYLHIFHIRLLSDADLNNVPLTRLPLPCPTVQQCHLPFCIFLPPQQPLSLLSVEMCSVSYIFYYLSSFVICHPICHRIGGN